MTAMTAVTALLGPGKPSSVDDSYTALKITVIAVTAVIDRDKRPVNRTVQA